MRSFNFRLLPSLIEEFNKDERKTIKTFSAKYNENRIDNWDGICDDGSLISSGIYFIILNVDGSILTQKLSLIR